MDLTPAMEWLGLLGYVVKTSDVNRQLWEIVEARVAERQAEIEVDAEEARDR